MESCVIGAGNPLREDDGVGLVVVENLKTLLPGEIADFITLEEPFFELQRCFNAYRNLVIIDAVPPGNCPGKISFRRMKRFHGIHYNPYSLHDMDLLWQIRYAILNGFSGEILLVGIETESTRYGSELSINLKHALPLILSRLKKMICKFIVRSTLFPIAAGNNATGATRQPPMPYRFRKAIKHDGLK